MFPTKLNATRLIYIVMNEAKSIIMFETITEYDKSLCHRVMYCDCLLIIGCTWSSVSHNDRYRRRCNYVSFSLMYNDSYNKRSVMCGILWLIILTFCQIYLNHDDCTDMFAPIWIFDILVSIDVFVKYTSKIKYSLKWKNDRGGCCVLTVSGCIWHP